MNTRSNYSETLSSSQVKKYFTNYSKNEYTSCKDMIKELTTTAMQNERDDKQSKSLLCTNPDKQNRNDISTRKLHNHMSTIHDQTSDEMFAEERKAGNRSTMIK